MRYLRLNHRNTGGSGFEVNNVPDGDAADRHCRKLALGSIMSGRPAKQAMIPA